MTVRRSRLSDEYVRVSVTLLPNSDDVDLETDVVVLAVKPVGEEPADDDWFEGEWESATVARALQSDILDQDAPFEVGRYKVWAGVVDHPEVPRDEVYTLVLY